MLPPTNAICHPPTFLPAGVLALPSDYEGDLAAGFAALWHMPALPPLMQAGVMEAAAVLRHYVLVHDASSAAPAVAAAAAERARAAAAVLGAPCYLLTINSGGGGGSPVPPRLWADALHASVAGGGAGEPAERPSPPPGGLGAWLSEDDTSGLASFVHELAVRGVIPHMEARLRALNGQVSGGRAEGVCARHGCGCCCCCCYAGRQAGRLCLCSTFSRQPGWHLQPCGMLFSVGFAACQPPASSGWPPRSAA